jgi:hypothetical protein
MLATMQLGTRSVRLPTCPHRAVLSSKRIDHALQPHLGVQHSHGVAGLVAARRGSLVCAAAKRPNSKKKAAAQKGKAKATVKDRPQAPDAPPAQGSTSTRDRSALQAEQRQEQQQQQQQQQQHEQPQQARDVRLLAPCMGMSRLLHSGSLRASFNGNACLYHQHSDQSWRYVQAEADSEPAAQPEREPVQAGMQQVAEPPSAPDSSYAQRQEQALAEARGPQENASELRQLMQQQQQSQQKPNLLQVREAS